MSNLYSYSTGKTFACYNTEMKMHIEGLAQNYCIYNFKIFQEIEKTAQFS